ncbi:translocation/assembly module TamB domain-containing protein [Phormidesmis sp. 146-35]
MTNPPEQGTPPTPRRRRSRLVRIGIPLGIAAVAGIGAGVWYGTVFVNQELAPLVADNLTQLLNRPVKLGKVERFSLTGLRFGKSEIPPTEDDPDRATVESVEVGFNPIQLVFNRTLKLDVALIKPTAYIEQDRDGVWVSTAIKEQEEKGFIRTQLEVLELREANIELSPFPKPGRKRTSVNLTDVAGEVKPLDRNRRFAYEAEGKSTQGGSFDLKGESLNQQGLNSNIDIRGQDFLIAEIDRLVKLPVDLTQGRVNGQVNVKLRPKEPALVNGTADFKNVTLSIPQLPQKFTNANGKLQLKETLITLEQVSASLGKIPLLAKGTLDTKKGFNLSAQVKAVTLDNFFETFAIQLPFAAVGEVGADVKVTGAIASPVLTGVVRNTKVARVDRLNLSQASANFRLDASTFDLAVSNLQATPTIGGQITGQGNLSLAPPRTIAFNLNAQNVPGDTVARLYNNGQAPPITVGRVNSQIQLSGAVDRVQTVAQFQAPQATYPTTGEVAIVSGNTILRNIVAQVGGGTVTANGRTIGENWQATVRAIGVQARQFVPQLTGLASGNFNLSGTTKSFNLADIRATGKARLTEGTGAFDADIASSLGRWQARVTGGGLQLSRFSPDLRGLLSGDLRVAGLVNSLSAGTIRANGQVRLSEGISLIEQPIVAQVQWDGRKLNIPQATAPGFSANGSILARLEGAGSPAITGLDLFVKTTNYALANLPIPRPPVTDLTGQLDLTGRITGTPDAPNVIGDVAVKGLSLNGITFDSPLNGSIRLVPTQGFTVNVAGGKDQIFLALNPDYRPIALNVKRDQAIIAGKTEGNIFRVVIQQLPLDGLIIPGVDLARLGSFGGRFLTGNLNIDVNRLQVADGSLNVVRPAREVRGIVIEPETIQARFVNTGNVIRFTDTFLQKGTSRYALSGSVDLRSTPKFEGKVAIAQGKLEDVLRTLRIFEIQDFSQILQAADVGRAETVVPTTVGLPDASLSDQLKRFSEINTLLRRVANDRRNLNIPELADVRGTFNGNISVSAGLGSPPKAEFDLTGQDIEWRPFPSFAEVDQGKITRNPNRIITIDQVIAKGSFENGVVNLLPLRLQSGDARINVSGNFGGASQSGQVQVTNLPVGLIETFYPLPIGITGNLNATATISGTQDNPFAIGEISLADSTLNGTPVQSATGSFNYTNARLNFGTTVTIAPPEPLRIAGSIPIKLPFASTFPDSNQISLSVNVKNEGLALLNLLTQQVAWVDGKGDVQLQVGGTLLQPVVTGVVTVQNAQLLAQALPEPITDLTGTITFERDRIRVGAATTPLTGQFSKGRLSAQGVIPIFSTLSQSDPDVNTPIALALNDINLTLKGLYQGGVSGNVALRGTALSPEVGGEIQLADGQVLLPDTSAAPASTGGGTTGGGTTGQPDQFVELQNLRLVLGDRVRVTRAPIINFLARGELLVNGSLNDLKPNGTIRLTAGQVNLFTTQFVLARGGAQSATFTPAQGLDPILNIRLIASVPEVTRSRISANTTSSEIEDNSLLATSLGSLQTIRIQARATGAASQLFENLELTSSPSRSQNEIIALIGGGFVNTLGRGDSTLGIANLAGSALLTNIQGLIGNALGFGEFRLFPTVINDENRRSSTLGLGAELSIDITRGLSASALKVLTSDQPTQFGVRYRINNRLLLRGSTDFSGDNRAVVEYETRF